MSTQTNQEQRPRPDLLAAIHADQAARQQAADAAAAPERERFNAALDHDAALFGTPGWSRLSETRRARVAHHVVAKRSRPEAA
ncbi:hypothetical protein KPP03845_102728 [Streptomyces xanthophaeus]|uniref:hypothetical protein n=1 Tax=Streptomyces xanthophaeus TaxID=67385 RepID=UPI00233ED379|nr:hypothetical protein [Streptomyces xanthophaeus]WCD86382.1 hypothetical protein KPP03845_102728 [Streptomyces xanthophaeus]